MPHVKTESITFQTHMGSNHKNIKISVDKQGIFSTSLEVEYELAIKDVVGSISYTTSKRDRIRVEDKSMDTLIQKAKQIFKVHYEPEVYKEAVIIYNIESHVSFAEDDEGNIYPHATYDGAKWRDHSDKRFGQHHATNPAKNGYSLTIGAKAQWKITYKFGDTEKVEYKKYDDCEAAKSLNSWCSFSLHDYKEMPYSDEAADFFYNLLYGMAKISQMIQDSTFDQQNLLSLIASGNQLLIPNKPKGEK